MPARSVSCAISGANGVFRMQADRRLVDDLDLVDLRDLRPAERALHRQVPVEAELRRLGVERLAVVELHALAQLDGDRLAVAGDLVRSRELGHEVELLVDVEQLVADRREDDAADVGARERRVEDVRVFGEADAERGLRKRGQGEQRACGGDDELRSHADLPGMVDSS